jgi:prepilin-type N-terminal cleavage/methylation domain-containing protein
VATDTKEKKLANSRQKRPENQSSKHNMKINILPNKRAQSAFTLIEMIGVLAVIAILAALLIPKVFSAIADAKINNCVVSAETVKTALADHYGKYGKFDCTFGTNGAVQAAIDAATQTAPYLGYDTNVLMFESLLDKPFQTKLGSGWGIQVRPCESATQAVDGGTHASYSLDGTTVNSAQGQFVLEAVISGVPEADAQAISARLDGPNLTTTSLGVNDYTGKVIYTKPATAGGAVTVYIYLTHR